MGRGIERQVFDPWGLKIRQRKNLKKDRVSFVCIKAFHSVDPVYDTCIEIQNCW